MQHTNFEFVNCGLSNNNFLFNFFEFLIGIAFPVFAEMGKS